MTRWCKALQKHYETKIDPDWIDVRKCAPPKDTLIDIFFIENAGAFSVNSRVGYLPRDAPRPPAKITHWKHLSSPPRDELLEHRNSMLGKSS